MLRRTTVSLLALLKAQAPTCAFTVRKASPAVDEDGIQLDGRHWLWIDRDDELPMVTLTDETPDSGGQIQFWMVRSQAVLSDVVQAALELNR